MLEITSPKEFNVLIQNRDPHLPISDVFFNFDLVLEKPHYFSNCKFSHVLPAGNNITNTFANCLIGEIYFDDNMYTVELRESKISVMGAHRAMFSDTSLITKNKIDYLGFSHGSLYWPEFYSNFIDDFVINVGTSIHLPRQAENNYITLGIDIRGHIFLLKVDKSGNYNHRIRAGCRNYTLDEAYIHWRNSYEDYPVLHKQILSFLESAENILDEFDYNELNSEKADEC